MSILDISTSYIDNFIQNCSLNSFPISLLDAHTSLQKKTCKGADFLGWIDLPEEMSDERIVEIQNYAKTIRENSDILIICGIWGSYLWARGIIECLKEWIGSKILYLGNHMSGREYERIFAKHKDKNISACIISKSGTTMETAVSYRLIRNFLLTKYSETEVQQRIITITDEKNGALRSETDKQWYQSYILPGNIGGRYSVLSPVGLFPCAIAWIDIQKLTNGARQARRDIFSDQNHPAFIYAEKRVQLEQAWLVCELFITSESSLHFMGEWWKQLIGESHGKEGKWLYPDTLTYTTDLHSLGQYVQEGRRLFFETMLWIKNSPSTIIIPPMEAMSDGLDPLVGKSLHELNFIALESTAKAHNDGGCPSMMITLENLDEYNIGYFIFTMEYACALSGIMIGVNPFDQPWVEAYKSEMRKRLK